MQHMVRVSQQDKKGHVLPYGFWIGVALEYLQVPVRVWHFQMTKDAIGVVNQVVVPASSRGSTATLQRLRDALAAKNVENEALRVSHQDAITMLHGAYEIE